MESPHADFHSLSVKHHDMLYPKRRSRATPSYLEDGTTTTPPGEISLAFNSATMKLLNSLMRLLVLEEFHATTVLQRFLNVRYGVYHRHLPFSGSHLSNRTDITGHLRVVLLWYLKRGDSVA